MARVAGQLSGTTPNLLIAHAHLTAARVAAVAIAGVPAAVDAEETSVTTQPPTTSLSDGAAGGKPVTCLPVFQNCPRPGKPAVFSPNSPAFNNAKKYTPPR